MYMYYDIYMYVLNNILSMINAIVYILRYTRLLNNILSITNTIM